MTERKCKERPRIRCLTDPNKSHQLSASLDGRRWRFLKPGLDDFRNGRPKYIPNQGIFLQTDGGTSPVIFGRTSSERASVKTPKKRFIKQQACLSKLNPQQQAQRQHVDAVEHTLTQHPLALYPHLESGMSPELFDEVLSVLDPDMCIKSEETLPQKPHEEGPLPCESITEQSAAESERLSLHTTIEQDSLKTCSQKNPFILKENGGKSAKDDQIDEVDSLYEDEDLKKVTRLFCEWAASLGGEDNLTESKILGMFTSGHERKPPLSFPIEVVEPNQIPPELRSSTEDMSSTLPCSSKEAESEKVHRSTKKMKYGVWYLDPKTWKEARDPLRDDAEEVGGKLSDKDEELKQMYGTQAFKTFLTNKGLRWPGFLRSLFPEEEEVKRARKNDTAGSASTHKDTVVL